ncbi:hypothetical protein LXL04_011954 [Taraxacum kok-saghyz]
MCEPLSVGVHACLRANIGPETNVLVMGATLIELVTILVARAFGAPRIMIVDVDGSRFLMQMKSSKSRLIFRIWEGEVEWIQKSIEGGVDVSFDSAGMGHHEMTVVLGVFCEKDVEEAFETSALSGNDIKVMFNWGMIE